MKDSKIEKYDFSTINDTALETELDQLGKSVDMVKITDKLSDGMSRVPSGTVDSPVKIQDNTKKPAITRESLEAIQTQYLTLKIAGKSFEAENFLEDMKRQGKLPIE